MADDQPTAGFDSVYALNMILLQRRVLIDFSLTVKAATVIFISGRGSAISSAKQGESGSIYKFGEELISCLGCGNVRAFHENPNRIQLDLTFINP